MASLHKSVPAAHYLIDARRIPFAGVHAICNHLIISPVTRHFKVCVNSRFKKNEVLLLAKHKRGPVSATNPNSDKLQETKRTDAASGPPFLTILAGVIVFFLICWIIGSILMWVVGLIVHPPQPK